MPVAINDPVNNFGPRPHLEVGTRPKFWTYLSVIALVVALGLSLSQVSQNQSLDTQASGGVVLSMIKSKTNLQQGEEFTVDILLDAREAQATHADIYLTYPENVLQAEEVTPTNFLPDAVEPAALGPGTALIRLGGSAPQRGGGILATLKFRALESGNPAIQFSNETIVTDQTQEGQVSNLVDKAIGLKFEIQ